MIKMTINEYKDLFNKFSLDSLESINLLLPNSNQEAVAALLTIFRNKLEQERDEYEGMNEYDRITALANFSLDELDDNIQQFSEKELSCLRELLSNMPLEKTEKYINSIDVHESSDITYIDLKILFFKYNLNELDTLRTLFTYVKEPGIEVISRVLEQVYNEKAQAGYEDFEVPVKSEFYSPYDIVKMNEHLTDKEIDFLFQLVDSAYDFISSVVEFQDEYSSNNEDFDINEYPVDLINKLDNAFYRERQKRQQQTKETQPTKKRS